MKLFKRGNQHLKGLCTTHHNEVVHPTAQTLQANKQNHEIIYTNKRWNPQQPITGLDDP